MRDGIRYGAGTGYRCTALYVYDTDLFMAVVAGYVERGEFYGVPLIEVCTSLDQETANLKEIKEYIIYSNKGLKILTS